MTDNLPKRGRPSKKPPQEAMSSEQEATPSEKDKYDMAAERRRQHKQNLKRTNAIEGQRLVAPSRPGFHRRWVNDEGPGLQNRLQRGYEFVTDDDEAIPSSDEGSRKSQIVGTGKDGQPLRAYLMEIREDFYEEDQRAREESIRKNESQIRRAEYGGPGDSIGATGHAYAPKGSQLLNDGN
mgnify:CR=1 FL=1